MSTDTPQDNAASAPRWERLHAHQAEVGGLPIRRALPTARRRMVGAWCFLDHAGPASLPEGRQMRVGPHPHTGLQTFSWMMEGEILHRDSLGSEQWLRPGQVNLMSAGRGISHSEEARAGAIQLAQLWIALPEAHRFDPPAFSHHPELPRLTCGDWQGTLLVGDWAGQRSPVPVHTPLLGLDLACDAAAQGRAALRADFEYGLMVLEGELALDLDGEPLGSAQPGELIYLAPGAQDLTLDARAPARALLLGGPPFPEPVLLWWNFVGRSGEEIQRYAAEWNAREDGGIFGQVRGYDGPRLPAPDASALRLRTPGA